MKPRFRWRTEEEEPWLEPEQFSRRGGNGRRPLWLLLLVGMLGVTLLFLQQMKQVRLQEDRVKQDVLAVHSTWLKAVLSRDVELMSQLLSREDIIWLSSQRRQLVQNSLLDRRPLGLNRAGEPVVTAVVLSPDWQKAEVTSIEAFSPGEGRNPVMLEQIRTYGYDGSRWLQIPPDEEFWGEWQTYSGERVHIKFPARDATWIKKVARKLDGELIEACLLASGCLNTVRIELFFTNSPTILTALRDEQTPVFDGRAFLLPAPSLAGIPQDEAGFQALYAGYTRRIVQTFRNQLESPLPLPDQDLLTLCFPAESPTVKLFHYKTAVDEWTAELSERTFASISPLPDDNGVILQERFASGDPSRLSLLHWQSGHESPLFDFSGGRWMYPPVGWSGLGGEPYLLVQGADAISGSVLYHRLDLNTCDRSGCSIQNLAGYTVWSPDGRRSIVQVESTLYLADESGSPMRKLASGFNPFWLDNKRIIYIRYIDSGAGTTMELVQAEVDNSAEASLLLRPDGIPGRRLSFFYYAAPNPADPDQLFIVGPNHERDSRGYLIYSLEAGDRIELRLELSSKPYGYPLMLTPTGYPPFLFSPDGRYLVLTELVGDVEKSWMLYLHEVAANKTTVRAIDYPPYPARYPFYDWSADGRWLAVMDEGFIRLIAPDYEYERLVTYDYDACFFTAWVNR